MEEEGPAAFRFSSNLYVRSAVFVPSSYLRVSVSPWFNYPIPPHELTSFGMTSSPPAPML